MRIIVAIDTVLSFLIPFLACGYLIYTESYFNNYIMLVGWLVFLLNLVAYARSSQSLYNSRSALWSLLNIIFLVVMLSQDLIDLEGFLLLELMSEMVSYPVVILLFVISNRKINGENFWKAQGTSIAILNVVILSIVVFPFIMEWIFYLKTSNESYLYWIATSTTLIVVLLKKWKILSEVVFDVNGPKEAVLAAEEVATQNKKRLNIPTFMFGGLILFWFITFIILVNIR
ncbi:MAG: hypothetical protein R2780_02045 [Crocinitomicaceae bacterium]|nr:hypothetical protein [Crocinitomicaceae bacterium]